MLKFRSLGILLMLFWFASCTEEDLGVTFVTTEEVLFASGDQVRLLGRVISDQDIQVQDHGFYLAEDEAFSNPQIISLGEKSGPGRFIGEISGLRLGTNYFAKAFLNLGGEVEFGNVISLSTLEPAFKSFSPSFGAPGEELIIEGRNFGEGTRVFFGDQEAEVLENTLQSRLLVRVPPPADNPSVPIRVLFQDREVSSAEPFEYQRGGYEIVARYPGEVRMYDNVFFQNDPNNLYIGLGSERRQVLISGFQKFDVISNTWSAASFPGTNRSFAFFTDHYLGGGVSQLGSNPFVYDGSFWAMENGGFKRLPDLPFLSRNAIAFEINGDLYVLGRNAQIVDFFFKFDKTSNTWEILPPAPVSFSRSDAAFSYGDKGYLINGGDGTLWSFDPSNNEWSTISTYPGALGIGRGMARVMGEKAFIGLFERTDEIWELDLNSFTWRKKNPMPGLPQSVLVAHFVSGPYLYIMRVPDINVPGAFSMDFYRFDPEGI
ncbi:hypothetical protein E4S40_14760 [Algoriphagus kandeliae]|uniref:IPT/TIG domain-containing protein n=1 Tax=Algoriphagus kandeliae TaxID=2562278 RepID=A0A4Y9QR28_9BACT|nr:IPT/TIG domain-containing protein [Algoriphagus kandeliae]TFV93506.1 hypothetical protein E4S40_14760 [Algoriphagus kandeliae]